MLTQTAKECIWESMGFARRGILNPKLKGLALPDLRGVNARPGGSLFPDRGQWPVR